MTSNAIQNPQGVESDNAVMPPSPRAKRATVITAKTPINAQRMVFRMVSLMFML
jgi:hypothetical protein